MKLFRWRCATGLFIVFAVGAVGASSGCSPIGTPASSLITGSSSSATSSPSVQPVSTGLVLLQKNTNLAAEFRAMVPRTVNGNVVDSAAQYFIPALPITWTGASFRGRLIEHGPGQDTVNDVSGLASDDGKQLVSLVYSRLITGTGPGSGTFYQVVLRNVPVSTGVYQAIGPDVQQYVVMVESGNNLANVQIDWSNTNGGLLPSLTVTFNK